MVKVMIFGGRDFNNYNLLKEKCDEILKDIEDEIVIVSGKASGADSLGEKYVEEKGCKIEEYPAKWNDLNAIPCRIKVNRYGREYNTLAGMNRNKDMINVSDIAIGFWDGKSRGTANSIQLAKKTGIRLEVIKYWE